jgi:hypothetical protein
MVYRGLYLHGRPQTSVLLGGTGLGKTRIVQPFYSDIATCEMISEYRVMKAHTEKGHNELMLLRVKDLVDKTLNTLRLCLDSSINDAPSVPVVLVIDDAQWIVPVNLQALFCRITTSFTKTHSVKCHCFSQF